VTDQAGLLCVILQHMVQGWRVAMYFAFGLNHVTVTVTVFLKQITVAGMGTLNLSLLTCRQFS